MTFAQNGDLLTYLQKSVKFDLDVARFYAAEIVHAIEHMHMMGIIHRDLKPENILLTADRHILVTDFGSCKILPKPPLPPGEWKLLTLLATWIKLKCWWNETEMMWIFFVFTEEHADGMPRRSSFVGTAQYVSPEILTDKRSSPASDLWATGCIVYQMIDGQPPFQGRSVNFSLTSGIVLFYFMILICLEANTEFFKKFWN